MYIFKNAWISITRNLGRNILIGMIILVMALTSTISLAIYNSSNKLIESYENSYDVTASIGMNRDALMKDFDPEDQNMDDVKENFNNIENLTAEEIKEYGDSKYVKKYHYTSSVNVNANIDKAESENSMPGGDRKMPGGEMENEADFTLTGYNSKEAMTDFIEGKYKITSGEISESFEDNTCVINKELASLNDLSVGDKITLSSPNDEDITCTLTISGIFEENSEESGMNMFSNSANTIITNITAFDKFTSKDEEFNVNTSPTFVLTSKDVIEKFEEELKDKGLNEFLSLNTNLDQVESSTKSISNVKTFALTFLIITLIIGSIVLFVINMINVRERKYEIGVLRTIGMKKSKVSLQFMVELVIVAAFALSVGALIGTGLSKPVANKLLENEIDNSTSQMENINENFGGKGFGGPSDEKGKPSSVPNGMVVVEQVDNLNAIVDYKVIIGLLSIGVALTIISSAASMIAIQRFSPLDILKERS